MLFTALLILLIGAVTASDTTNHTTVTNEETQTALQDTTQVSQTDTTQEKNNNNNEIIMNTKQETPTTKNIQKNTNKANTKTETELPPEPEKPLPQVKNIIAVSSGKGGVGKSTVAVNLAIGLTKMGYRVGLLDADIFGPSVPKMLQTEDGRPYAENVDGRDMIVPIEKYGVKMLSIGFFVNPDQATLWRGAMASNAIKQLITDALWGELDYLVIDTPPGTSDIHLTLIQTIDITGAVIVSTPQQVALADARKGIKVENMAWFTPAQHPDERYFIFGQEGCKQLAQELQVPLLAQIPLVQDVCQSGDDGTPAVNDPASPAGMAFMQLTAKVVTQTDRLNTANS